jgi:hypothetical protein
MSKVVMVSRPVEVAHKMATKSTKQIVPNIAEALFGYSN